MPKKKAAVEAVTPVVDVSRYQRPARYRWFEYSEMPGLEEGQEPLRVKLRSNLSFMELDQIPFSAGVSYTELFQAIAPYVVEWNVQRTVIETGEMEAVPPPAEAGWEVLQVLDHIEANWVAEQVKYGYLATAEDAKNAAEALRKALTDAKKNGSRGSGTTPVPSNAEDSGSEA
jgi:hypothetical protein